MSGKRSRSFQEPDERRDFQRRGHLDVLNFENGQTVGRGEFEPGWRWSKDVKPIAGTEFCEAAHYGYCLEGRMTIQMKDGETFTIQAGEVFEIPPGHDAWTDANPCVLVDFGGLSRIREKESCMKELERQAS